MLTGRTARRGLTLAIRLAVPVGLRLVMAAAAAAEVRPLEPQVRPDCDGDDVVHFDVLAGVDALLQAVLAERVLAVVGGPEPSPVLVVAPFGRCAPVSVCCTLITLLLVFGAVAVTSALAAVGNTATRLKATWARTFAHVLAPSKWP